MFIERACVGLDVHARSIAACAMDNEAGEIKTLRLSPKTSLPGPVAVTYEAGPTGFGVARALDTAGVQCVVVAPSKLERPPGDRVKTDRRDAERLARLLRIGELPGVRVPSEAEESARDLVRAGEDVRGDLMRARHRLSKLLLRQGLLWENSAWTGAHEAWLRAVRFERVGVRLVFDEAFDTVLATQARRDRLDAAITEMPRQGAVRADRGAAGISTLTAFGLATEIGAWHRFTGSSIGAYLGLVPATPAVSTAARARSPRPVTATRDGCWSRPRGTTAKRYRPSRELVRLQDSQPPAVRARAELGNSRPRQRWNRLDARANRPTISAVAVARELAGWWGSLAVLDQAG